MDSTPSVLESLTPISEEERRYVVTTETSEKKGYKVHALDQLVEGRTTVTRTKNEDGTTSSARLWVAYRKPRYERYEPFVCLGKKYPFGSKRQGF
jgi:hypothetical protein